MNLLPRLAIIGLLFSILTACTNAPSATPDPDTLKFVALGEQAKQLAQKEIADAVLRQADTDLTKTIFRFTDPAGTQAIDVTVTSAEQMTTARSTRSPLLGRAATDMNLKELRLSPQRVAHAMTQQWTDCKIRTLTLFRNESEKQLTWLAFCSTTQGSVIAEINDATGTLKPVNLPAIQMPVTATPAR